MSDFNDDRIGWGTGFRYAWEAMGRRASAAPKFESLQAWIVSPGGVGTTFVMEHVAQFIMINDPYDQDDLKHWPEAPVKRLRFAATPVLFIGGDPASISASLARRRWLRIQARKLGSPLAVLAKGAIQKAAFLHAVERQIESWRRSRLDNVKYVEYHELWDRKAEIASHLGIIDPKFVETFPARKMRKSG